MVKCNCPNPKHTDPTGCILNHDGELGTVCQICFKLHKDDIQGLAGVIQCRHRKIKIETYHADEVDKYYCRICKEYITKAIADVALLIQVPSLKVWTGNRWGPDTCKCKVNVAFDHDTGQDEVYTYTTKGCPDHSNLRGQQFLDVMKDENNRKNGVLKNIIDNFPTVTKEITVRGIPRTVLADGVEYVFSFTGNDENRVLHIEIQGVTTLTSLQKGQLTGIVNSNYGVGRVIIE